MNDETHNGHDNLRAREFDPYGHAAILLVESLIHGLIEKDVLSVAEAVEIVDVATEVKIESGTELGEPTLTSQASIDLLRDISASLRFDLVEKVKRGTPV
ncbi:hypothetical protein [Aurantimonas sp. 22II-16-19i]|uniref:hypothetical protein n=1 Tax=Aurantimonas sp. 22II-16-19i TaxID=1317114 RepID=UPI0009F7B966|nr:hypothetical protein [Aurantimonas sp. 22II-16-19i]ORE95115.1 hypothetical protein ATO4_12316 [Aurantimonas sp. 22II-16-19i]